MERLGEEMKDKARMIKNEMKETAREIKGKMKEEGDILKEHASNIKNKL